MILSNGNGFPKDVSNDEKHRFCSLKLYVAYSKFNEGSSHSTFERTQMIYFQFHSFLLQNCLHCKRLMFCLKINYLGPVDKLTASLDNAFVKISNVDNYKYTAIFVGKIG